MKKIMKKPMAEFIEFETEDVILASGGMDVNEKNTKEGYGDIIGGIGDLGGGTIGKPLQ